VAGWCNTADVVAQAVRAKNLGCRIMIDFHYSDTWADPGNNTTLLPGQRCHNGFEGIANPGHQYKQPCCLGNPYF